MEMEIFPDPRLNLFKPFGGSWENENNTTRALLVALSRSPASFAYLRAFLDLIRDRVKKQSHPSPEVREQCCDLLSQFPDQLHFNMQRGAANDKLSVDSNDAGVLIAVTPTGESEADGDVYRQGAETADASGIVDAWLRFEYGEPDEDEQGGKKLQVVIESKLYGPVGRQQRQKYLAAMGKERTIQIDISWEEVYNALQRLPEQVQSDPILADFREFMVRDPRLVGFTGFTAADKDARDSMTEKLRHLCSRIVNASSDAAPLFYDPEQVRGSPDFNLRLQGFGRLAGNVGIGKLDRVSLFSKLVLGSKVWEWKAAQRDPNSHSVLKSLEPLVSRGLEFWLITRFRPPDAVQTRGVKWNPANKTWTPTKDNLHEQWAEVIDAFSRYQRMSCTAEMLNEIRDRFKEINDEALQEAEQAAREGSPWKVYSELVLVRKYSLSELDSMSSNEQVRRFTEDQRALAGVLLAMNGKDPEPLLSG